MSDSNIPAKPASNCRTRPGAIWALLAGAVVIIVGGILGGCDDEHEVLPIYAQDHLGSYIEYHKIGKELFRTDGLFPSNEYVRPTDPSAVYREFVDSSYRRIGVDVTEEVDYGAPYDGIDMAEMTVLDNFRIRTERTEGTAVDTTYDWRAINRHGLFWRLNVADQDYGGWVLHAFNGGGPRDGFLDGTVVETEEAFKADARAFSQLRYIYYQDRKMYDSAVGRWIVVTDTLVTSTTYPYQPLESSPVIDPGHSVAFAHTEADPDAVYELLTAVTDSAGAVRVMIGPTNGSFVDTLLTPDNDPGQWNLVLFRTFLSPDRWGDAWVVPYRTAGE